jgi:hypothetical protein
MTTDLVSPLVVLERFRQTLIRLGLDDEPVRAGDILPTVFADLARAVDDHHREIEAAALAALARGDIEEATSLLRTVTEESR